MREVGAFAAKNTLGTLLDEVERGEEILITRHGRPVARLVPSSGGIDRAHAQAAMARIRVRASEGGSHGIAWATLTDERDAGRP